MYKRTAAGAASSAVTARRWFRRASSFGLAQLEDIVQEVLIRVLAAKPGGEELRNPEAWLFRVAHNASLDFLRHRARHAAVSLDDLPETAMNLAAPEDQSQLAATSLRTFMRLPVAQRSSVILMDVLATRSRRSQRSTTRASAP